MADIKELAKQPEHLSGGHRLCAGCGASIVVRQVLMGTKDPVVTASATGCLEVATTIYPYTAWKVPFIHNAFENVAATITGVETAYRALKKKGKINKEIKFVAFAGDGGSYDIGLQALSGALERGHKFVYVCLPPDTEIVLEDGSIVEIGQLVDESIRQHSKELNVTVISHSSSFPLQRMQKEDEIIESSPVKKSILSWNGIEFLPMPVVRVQRKTAPDSLIKITTSSGRALRLTQEHPVLIDGADGPEWKEACGLKIGDEVYSARKINIINVDRLYLIDLISENKNIAVSLPEAIRVKICKQLSFRFGNVKKASRYIGFKYWQLKERYRKINLSDLKRIYEMIPELQWDEVIDKVTEFVVQGGPPLKIKDKNLTEDMLYILGLISSDGYVRNSNYGITFVNKDPLLLEAFEESYASVIEGRKVNKVKDKSGVCYLTVEDPILYTLAKRFNIKNDPRELIKLSEPLIAAFIRGYFDGDGHCGIVKWKSFQSPTISLATTNKILSDRLRLLLQRLGIAGFQDERESRFDIVISSRQDIIRFIEVVGTKTSLKQTAMNKVRDLLLSRRTKGHYFSLAPRVCGKLLKDLCKKNSISITSMDRKRNICTLAAGKRRATKHKIKEYLDKINRAASENISTYKIKNFLVDDFYLDPIRKIEIVPSTSKYVYDLTVNDSHVFLPEGKFIVSNCYNNEAYMNTGVQRSGATPRGASTTTAPAGKASFGKPQSRKDLTAIVAAHRIPYVAQASVSHWNDLVTKSEKAFNADGPAFLNIISMCPRGWGFPPEKTIDVDKLSVETGYWPLVEVENGVWRFTYKPKERKPLIEFLKVHGRFKHLFNDENKHIIDELQKEIDENWSRLERLCEASCKVA